MSPALSWAVTGVAALVAVAALAVVVAQLFVLRPAVAEIEDETQARGAVVRAAERFTVEVNNYEASNVDTLKERNVPPYAADDYVAISHPTTYRNFKNSLEAINQYTETGLVHIYNGEIGRYEGTRFIEQTFIPKGGAADSVTFDPWTGTADPWNNGLSSWMFIFGADTCTEAVGIPEEIRASIPSDFGRSKAIAWYYLGGFGLAHPDATNARVIKWDSAA